VPETSHRRYLMCRPTYFDVRYSINAWMDPAKPVDRELAIVQWERLCRLYRALGHEVLEVPPVDGLPDMVFAANGATVIGGRALVARFRFPERAGESIAYQRWFAEHGWPVRMAEAINEGEGDFLLGGGYVLAGNGFRSDLEACEEAEQYLRRPVVPLTLVDPRFYHLDTALAVLDDRQIAYFPDAFDEASRSRLAELFPDAVLAGPADAASFGLNAVSDGYHVVMSQTATGLMRSLRQRGYQPIGVDVSELRKSGGGAKCCTLELH
jgi:N-dimethylarginine dimethylaminohydrolase